MFDRLEPRLGDFYRMMVAGGFTDLQGRAGKAGGAVPCRVGDGRA